MTMGLISDLRAISNPSAFEWAVWSRQGKQHKIKVEVRSAWSRDRGTTAGSIIADVGRITVSTRYIYPYGINDHLYFRGKTYVIEGFDGDNYEITPQNTIYIKPELSQEITMRLFEANEQTRNLRVPTPVLTSDGTNVTITVPDVMGASIYYETATEGQRCNNPSSLSKKYSGAIPIGSGNTQIKTIAAIALKEGYLPSVVAVWRDD